MATLQCPLLQTKGELINGRNQTINQITDVKPLLKKTEPSLSNCTCIISTSTHSHFKYKYTHLINKHLHEVHFRK